MPQGVVLMIASNLALANCSRFIALALALCASASADLVGAIDDEHLRALLDQSKDGSARRTACAENCDARAQFSSAQAFFERPHHAGYVGVEAVELAVGAGAQCVAGADARGERVHVGQKWQHLLLQAAWLPPTPLSGSSRVTVSRSLRELDLERQHARRSRFSR